jgi:DinB superfamily
MDQWQHLFIDGEFMPRARLLSGLTAEQVNMRPPGLSHTIYEELWHTAKYQSIVVVQCGDPASAAPIDGGEHFPSEAPGSESMWEDLVAEFHTGSEAAAELGRSSEALKREVSPGVTLADELESLAVHNAYHLGKIVALRQFIGAWPPPR